MSIDVSRLTAALEGRYAIERELGEGGMAVVYLAEDLKHDRKVALKVLKPELAAVVGGDRFVSEIKTTANLQHPHILPLFDSGEADGFLFYVMPYVEGETLRERLDRERQLPVGEAISITTKIAAALQGAHDEGVIHRDIKPANILLQKGEPVVSDFGIALAVSEAGGGRLTETGLSLGTPYYMAPEQATADRDPDQRSDIYSLACLTYEMLAGEPPFTGSSAQAVLGRILTQAPPHVTAERSSVPHNVDAAILQALQKVPADRFASVEEFAAALNELTYMGPAGRASAVVPGAGAAARSAGPGTETGPSPSGRPVLPWAVAGVALLAAVAAFALRPAAGTTATYRLDLDLDDFGGPGNFTGLKPAISPDGSHIAIGGSLDGRTGIYLRDLAEADFQFVPGTENGFAPTFSPDGEWIAFAVSGGALRKVTLSGGGETTLLDVDSIDAFNPHWGTDDGIVITGPDGTYLVSATSGAIEDVRKVADLGPYDPFLLPDGSAVISSGQAGAGGLLVHDLEADTTRSLLPSGRDPEYLESGHLLYVGSDGGLFALEFDLAARQTSGTPVRLLDRVAGGVGLFHVSRNGTLVYADGPTGGGGGQEELRLANLGDAAAERLALELGAYNAGAFSPDGRYVAFAYGEDSNRTDLYTFDLLTQDLERLTTSGTVSDPAWSPDGAWLAFGNGETSQVAIVPADGSSDPVDLGESTDQLWPTQWFEENRILVGASGDEAADAAVVELEQADGGWEVANVTPYLTAPYGEFIPRLSPAGDFAVFVSERTDAEEVWIASFPEPTAQYQVTNRSGNVGNRTYWSADGSRLYFMSANPSTDTLFSVDVLRDPVRPLDPEYVMHFPAANADEWAFDPLNERVLVNMPEGAMEGMDAQVGTEAGEVEPTRFFVVINWQAEFERRFGGAGR
jgi:serine/threonine-protein kinase